MEPLGKLRITVHLDNKQYRDDIDIYTVVAGALITRRTSKGLGILPDHYRHLQPVIAVVDTILLPTICTNQALSIIEFKNEFCTVFDSNIYHLDSDTSLTKDT